MSSASSEAEVFRRYSRYYDLLYQDKDYVAEADYIARTLRDVAPNAKRILEFGSGTGRHGRLLAERGYHIFGVERSDVMASIAREAAKPTNGSFDCIQGDVQTARAPGAPFDAVISLFHVVSYQTTNDALLATFENAARNISAGGVFFFDVWHGPAVLTQRPAVRLKQVENADVRLKRIAQPSLDDSAGVVTVHYTIFAETKKTGAIETFEETHHMRYLFPTEIDLLARQTGFAAERTEEFGSGRPPSSDSWGVAYVLRKK
jgi:SAM-dependent methyltransferase